MSVYQPDGFDLAWCALVERRLVGAIGSPSYKRWRSIWDTKRLCGRVDPLCWLVENLSEDVLNQILIQQKRMKQ